MSVTESIYANAFLHTSLTANHSFTTII